MSLLMQSKYIEYWEKYSNLRERTKENYRSVYKKFDCFLISNNYEGDLNFDNFIFVKDDSSFESIDSEVIDSFVEYLIEQKNSNNSLSCAISALGHLFKFLKAMKLIKKNPMSYYGNPFNETSILNRALSETEVDLLLAAALKMDPFLKHSYVLVLLLINTGLRNLETRELKFSKIDFEKKLIFVNVGQKTTANTVILSNHLRDLLYQYKSHPVIQKRIEEGNEYIFTRPNGKKLGESKHINNWLRNICQLAGVKSITAHCLRHTMAHLLYQAGLDLRLIQRQMRHKSVEITLRYLGIIQLDQLEP